MGVVWGSTGYFGGGCRWWGQVNAGGTHSFRGARHSRRTWACTQQKTDEHRGSWWMIEPNWLPSTAPKISCPVHLGTRRVGALVPSTGTKQRRKPTWQGAGRREKPGRWVREWGQDPGISGGRAGSQQPLLLPLHPTPPQGQTQKFFNKPETALLRVPFPSSRGGVRQL